MSEYAKWVRDQRTYTEDALETKIIQIDLKFVRSIIKGIDQSKGTPTADKKKDAEKAKAFLLNFNFSKGGA